MSSNMYRVGDYVFFEINSSSPFQIRRIEELNKTQSGNVEAKVMCFYRRRDISPALLQIADQHQGKKEQEEKEKETQEEAVQPPSVQVDGEVESASNHEEQNSIAIDDPEDANKENEQKTLEEETKKASEGPTIGLLGLEQLGEDDRHKLRHRELFLSRQIETLPATHIRGKCTVTLLNEMETPDSYLGKDEAFFYSLVYDPTQRTLLADKGEIRVGDKYQADVPEWEEGSPEPADRSGPLETVIFHPHHSLTDRDIDQFLIVARAVGTFSRALDTSSSVKLPSLHMTAAAASRDVTLFHAMALLHHANYDLGLAMKYLVPPPSKQHYPLEADKTTGHHTVSLGGPILCRDQMEEWSAAEANLFEEALDKYGKDFNDIRQDFLPWKSLKDIVEYYYMWKTTDRYVAQKRHKALEAESRLKQVYIPNYNKPNQNQVQATLNATNPGPNPVGQAPCESCKTESALHWFAWGPSQQLHFLCSDCWGYWKKFGGLKRPHDLENYDRSLVSRADQNGTAQLPGARTGLLGPTTARPNPAGVRGNPGSHQKQPYPGYVPNQAAGGPQHIGSTKTRQAFYVHTTPMTRIARRLAPKSVLNTRRAARSPFIPINMHAVKQFCQTRTHQELLSALRAIRGNKGLPAPAKTPPVKPPTLKRPAAPPVNIQNGTPPAPMLDGVSPPAKRPRETVPSANHVSTSAGRLYGSWTGTYEDACFRADADTKRLRRQLSAQQQRHLARTPTKPSSDASSIFPDKVRSTDSSIPILIE